MDGYTLNIPTTGVQTWRRESHGCVIEAMTVDGVRLARLSVCRNQVVDGNVISVMRFAQTEADADVVAADIASRWPAIMAATFEVQP